MMKNSFKFVIYIIIFLVSIEMLSLFIIRNEWILNTTSQESNTRWFLVWLKKQLSQEEITGFPIDIYHPILGWYPKKNGKKLDNGKKSIVNFNPDGVRGQKTYSKEKDPNKTKIVLVGDSFSFGEEVGDEDTFAAFIEKSIPNIEVINMAVHGYGIDQMNLRLNIDGFNYNPDIVIHAFISDDINRNLLNFRDYMKPKYELIDGNLELKNTPIKTPSQILKEEKYKLNTVNAFNLLRERVIYGRGQVVDPEPLTKAIWKQTVENTIKHNAIPIFLFLPTGPEMVDQTTPKLYPEEIMFSFCNTMSISCFSARPYLTEAFKNGVNYKFDVHYEPYTHKIIAEGLMKDLIKTFPELNIATTEMKTKLK